MDAPKRVLDLALGVPMFILLLPAMAVLAILVRRKLGTPVLFKQPRPGLRSMIFDLYKFRTMTLARDRDGELLPDGERLTGFGRWLRKTSLDELPQLLNVMRGELSLVGPRPLLVEYLPRYSREQARRHDVKPGITGWAQINGRNALTWQDKLDLDVWYVDHRSFWLDLKILCLTAIRVLKADGINQDGCSTMPEFLGGPEGRFEGIDHGLGGQADRDREEAT